MPRFRELLPWFSLTVEACRASTVFFLLLYQECRGFRLPWKRAMQINAVISDYCTENTVTAHYRGSVTRKCRDREKPCHDLPYQNFTPRTALKIVIRTMKSGPNLSDACIQIIQITQITYTVAHLFAHTNHTNHRNRQKHLQGPEGKRIGDRGPMGRILVRGEEGHDIIPELYPLPMEPCVDKPGKGAFFATDLDTILRSHGIEALIVCGVTTEVGLHD